MRVITNLDQKYIFKRIGKDEAGVYGVAPRNSRAARQLANDIRQEEIANDLIKIQIQENSIEEIHAQNKTLSVLVPLVITAAGILIFALTCEVGPLLPNGI